MTHEALSWPLVYSAAALTLVVIGGWVLWDALRKLQARRARRRARGQPTAPPPGTDPVLTPVTATPPADLPGLLFFVAVGSMGVNRLLATLQLLHTSRLDGLVGGILVIEHDAGVRAQVAHQLPAVFGDRLTYGFAEDYAGGMANKPAGWVLDHVDEWGVPLQTATRDAIDRFLRRSHSQAPALVFVFTSLGGQAPCGVVALAELAERFGDGETTLVAAATALPRHERLRERWTAIKPAYERFGVVGWLLIDNLAADVTTADHALVALLVGHLAAAYQAEQPTAANNVLALACTERPGEVLVFQVVASEVVAFPYEPDPLAPPRHFVYRGPLVVQVRRALRRLAAGQGVWSAALPVGEAGTSTFDQVLLPLVPTALLATRDAVLAGVALRQTLADALPSPGGNGTQASISDPISMAATANHELSFVSLPTHLDPARPTCPVFCLRLVAVRDGAALVGEIVKLPHARRFPVRRRLGVRSPLRSTTNTNGAHPATANEERMVPDVVPNADR